MITCICGGHSSQEFERRNFTFYRCDSCSLLFVSPRFNAESIYDESYFSGGAHGFGFSNYEIDKTASSKYLQQLLNWLLSEPVPSNFKLLDVGAANGFFVELCTKKGINAKGIEISQDAVNWAKRLGRNVTYSTLEKFSSTEKFTAITLLDVLEHIHNPIQFLAAAYANLEDKGYLLINVPNEGSLSAKLAGKNWHALLPPEHWFYFNKKSLKLLLEGSGFEVVKMKSISKSFTLSYIFLTILNSPQVPRNLRYMIGFFKPVFTGFAGNVKVFLPLYDNLSVVARKL
jgi:2-polyprenyl-3-methyl-5-hydroxy-6-metoxy-1,4-benzoquinol methylase